jgi:hypothetical protein
MRRERKKNKKFIMSYVEKGSNLSFFTGADEQKESKK